MSKVEVNQISSQCGSTLTIGQSGDTVTLASGATQTGFGRTGTVDWDTTAKTASFTAVSGNGYFVNTTSGAITVTLPATPSAGDIVAIKDYANTADTNTITIARNGSNIDGTAEDGTIPNEGGSVTLVYVDATKGWLVTDAAQKSDVGFPSYITATGGTITTCGNYKIHTFTGPGTFTVCSVGNPAGSDTVDYLVAAGGAGGGTGFPGEYAGGGGGAGGYRESSGTASGCYTASPLGACVSALPVTATGYPITVGGGGVGGLVPGQRGSNGSNSVFNTITSTGGGGGGNGEAAPFFPGNAGGSGGGSSGESGASGAAGNTPPVSPPQGQPGGDGTVGAPTYASGGGGGATGAGNPNGTGGVGATSSINGTSTARAGGGGGGGSYGTPQTGGYGGGGTEPTGSLAGAGKGGTNPASPPGTINNGTAATANSASGGGGGVNNINTCGAAGGSGIVIIRYRFQ
jgi:hypothetical protein